MMNCSGERNREYICKEYNVEAIGCFKLFGGHTVLSDAGGRIITDKYYLFRCTHKISGREETIKCGSTVARHLCNLSGNTMPVEFNPFRVLHANGIATNNAREGTRHWNKSRRQLYNAIMIFVTKYGDGLTPGSIIFRIKKSVEENADQPVLSGDVLAMNTILKRFDNTIPNILNDFAKTNPIRVFEFNLLGEILTNRGETENRFE